MAQVLGAAERHLLKEAEEKGNKFNHMPYFRLLVTWLVDFNCQDAVFEPFSFQVSEALREVGWWSCTRCAQKGIAITVCKTILTPNQKSGHSLHPWWP